MESAPELQSMTRRRRISPLKAAWVFVFVLIGATYAWLSLSYEPLKMAQDSPEKVEQDDVPEQNSPARKTQEPGIIVASSPDEDNHNSPAQDHSEDAVPQEDPVEDAPLVEAPQEDIPEQVPAIVSLRKAPISGLSIKGANGLLPVLGPDGMQAWQEYARPFSDDDNRPRIAIIVTGIGLSAKNTRNAIETLPPQVVLAFSPYGRTLQDLMDEARSAGHESLLMVPTEPMNYPENDPGPHSLMTEASVRDNLKRLDWLLSQVSGYVGVINHMGSKFTASETAVTPFLEDIKARGLMFVDSRASRFSMAAQVSRRLSLPRAINNRYIDNRLNADAIAQHLSGLENTARTYGAALGVARAYPITLRQINTWAKTLEERGFVLVPVSAIANRQPVK